MAATLTGTPTAVTWAAGSDPAGQSVTVPADCTAVYMFWAYFNATAAGGLSTVTLNGNSPNQTFEIPTGASDESASGVAAWYSPTTGAQTLDPAWDLSPTEGSVCIVAYVTGGDVSAWRDADAAQGIATAAVSVTLTTVSGDLVLKFDQRYTGNSAGAPGETAGWTSAQTHLNNTEGSRLQSISATGVTQACPSENEDYSTICAISIPTASAGSFIGFGKRLAGQRNRHVL